VKKVYIAVLSLGYIRQELAIALLKISGDNRYEKQIQFHGLRPSAHNRNSIVKEFLKTDCDYLLCIDHDNIPINNPLDLVELDKDVIGCPYPQVKNGEIGWLVMNKVPDGYRQVSVENAVGVQEVDAIASGVMLIARRVLEKVKTPFERKWKDGQAVKGLDFYFCDKARDLGFKVWVAWDYVADHYKEVSLLQVLQLLGKASK